MKNDHLTHVWNSQKNSSPLTNPDTIIKKAKKQRNGQFVSITIMSITVLVLLVYAISVISNPWNDFSIGLLLMISSLTFRIILELFSLYRKESQLMSLNTNAFHDYLKKHYRLRLKINYMITPLCFGIYLYGFLKLLPYFKREFSVNFYTYILISGFASLFVIALIIVNTIVKEHNFLKQLNRK